MSIDKWADNIWVGELQDDPAFTDDLTVLIDETESNPDVNVVLNFAGVTYVNSSNIAKLLKLRKQLINNKRSLVLASIDTNVWGVFMVTGLDKVFTFTDSVATALASVQMQAAE